MRGLKPAVIFIILLLAAGCKAPERPAGTGEPAADLRELGRPWPVWIGRFEDTIRLLGHDEEGLLFAAGRPPLRYRLDYRRRRLVRLGRAPSQAAQNGGPGFFAAPGGDGGLSLVLIRPDGTRLTLTGSLLGKTWAETGDHRAVTFYENGPEGPRLVYCEPSTGLRAVWRRLDSPPAAAALAFSEEGDYLAEEHDGILTVFARTDGAAVWSAEGAAPRFSPGERAMFYRRSDGRPGLLDPAAGYARVLPVPEGFRRVVSSAWSRDGKRIFYVCEAGGESGKEAARFLCLYEWETGAWQRRPLPGTLDPLVCPALLSARPAEVGKLLDFLPRLNEGTLSGLGEGFYLAGIGREIVLLNLDGKNAGPKTLYRFPGRVRSLSLAGRRLAVVVEEGEGAVLYAWRLPAPGALTGIFPDRRDLTLGRLALGMSTAELRAALGNPLETEKRIDPVDGQRILLTHHYPEAAVTMAHGQAEQIVYSGPGVDTPRGIAVGSGREEVLARYGRPDYELRDYLAYRGEVDGIALKVAFKFDSGGRVAAILLEREGGRRKRG